MGRENSMHFFSFITAFGLLNRKENRKQKSLSRKPVVEILIPLFHISIFPYIKHTHKSLLIISLFVCISLDCS